MIRFSGPWAKHATRFCAVCLAFLLVWSSATSAVAVSVGYGIDVDASSIDLSVAGSVFGGELTVIEQFPDDATQYGGTVAADFKPWIGPDGQLAFPGGGTAAAVNLRGGLLNLERRVAPAIEGEAGTDPANYGVTLDAPVEIDLQPIPLPDPVGEIDLGTLSAVSIDVAIRDLVIDFSAPEPLSVDGETFDASTLGLNVVTGFADVNGALILKQDDLLSFAATTLALEALSASMPELGLTTSGNLFALEVEVGIGTRFDLSTLPGAAGLPNAPASGGTIGYDPATGESSLTIPIAAALPDLGLSEEVFALQFGLEGELSGTAQVPEPSVLVLLVVGGAGLAGCACRRRKR